MTRTVRRLHADGAAVRTAFRSRARSIKRSLAAVGRSVRMRTEEAKTAVVTLNAGAAIDAAGQPASAARPTQ